MPDYLRGTERLSKAMEEIERGISHETDLLKSEFTRLSQSMSDETSYFLNGIQTGPVVKSYLLTSKGIEVPGEQTIEIPEFLDSVLRFANHPNKKIEMLRQLAIHLQNIEQIIREADEKR